MFIKKALCIISFIVAFSPLYAQKESDNKNEQVEFRRAGYGLSHFQAAQDFNLDLENYTKYRLNKKDRISGAIMTGVGATFVASGTIYMIAGASLQNSDIDDEYNSYSTSSYSTNEDEVFFIIGGIYLAGGLPVTIAGLVRRARSRNRVILKKDGNRLSFTPVVDPFSDNYGVCLSVNF